MLGKVGRKGGGGGKIQHPTPTKRSKRTHHEKIEVARPEEHTSISIADSLISKKAAERKAKSSLVVKEKNTNTKAPQTEVPKDFKQHQKAMERSLALQQEIDKVRKEHLLGKPEVEQGQPEVKRAKGHVERDAQVKKLKRMSFEEFEALEKLRKEKQYQEEFRDINTMGIMGGLKAMGINVDIASHFRKAIYENASDKALEVFFRNEKCSMMLSRYIYNHLDDILKHHYYQPIQRLTEEINKSVEMNDQFLPDFVAATYRYDLYGEGFKGVLDAHASYYMLDKSSLKVLDEYFKGGDPSRLLKLLDKMRSKERSGLGGGDHDHNMLAWEYSKWKSFVWSDIGDNCKKYGTPVPTFTQKVMGDLRSFFNSLFGHDKSQDKDRG